MNFLTLLLVGLTPFNFVFSSEVSVKRLSERNERVDHALERTLENMRIRNKRLEKILLQKQSRPLIWEGNSKIKTGDTFKGVLLNSIISSNLESPILIRATSDGLPEGSKFSCVGKTKNKRIFASCNRLIYSKKEISISTTVLNPDGSAGLLGEYYDGKEDLVAGSLISDFLRGVLDMAQKKISSPFGHYPTPSIQNEVYGGMINSAKTTSKILIDESKEVVPIVAIPAGIQVLVYFNEAINE